MTGPLAFAAILLFSCAALSVGAGFAIGRWYERTMRDTGPTSRPGLLLDHTHPERALVPFPLCHPAASAGPARPRLSVVPPDSDPAA